MGKVIDINRDLVSGMTGLDDKEWFESHQSLIIRMLQTDYGKDLLSIPRDTKDIVRVNPSSFDCYVGMNKDLPQFKSRYYSSDRFANLIKGRWKEFSSYAKHFYDNGGLTYIYLDDKWQLAATTSTYFPEPHVAPTNGDGQFVINRSTWAAARNSIAANSVVMGATSSDLFVFRAGSSSYDIKRLGFSFDLTLLTGTLDSVDFVAYNTGEQEGGLSGSSIDIVKFTPDNYAVYAATDFNNFSFDSVGGKAFSAITNNAVNTYPIDTTAITTEGLTALMVMMGDDFDDIAPPNINDFARIYFNMVENASNDPYLEAVWTESGRQRFIGQRPILTVDKQIIGNRGNPIIR